MAKIECRRVEDAVTLTSYWTKTKRCTHCGWMSDAPVQGFVNASPWAESRESKAKCCPDCGCELEDAVMRATVRHWRSFFRKTWLFGLLRDDWAVCNREHVSNEWRWFGGGLESHVDQVGTITKFREINWF